jgi:hypothetical protein
VCRGPPRGVEEEVGYVGDVAMEAAEVREAAVREHEAKVGPPLADGERGGSGRADLRSGVHHDRVSPLVRQGERPLEPRVAQLDVVARQVQLEPPRARVEKLLHPVNLLRNHPHQCGEGAVAAPGHVEASRVGRPVAVLRFRQREHQRPRASGPNRGQKLLDGRGHGVAVAQVGVHVQHRPLGQVH